MAERDGVTFFDSLGIRRYIQTSSGIGTSGQVLISGGANGDVQWTSSISSGSLPVASSSASGIVSTGAQSFAGNKTFVGSISASNLSGTNTGNVSLGTASLGLGLVGQVLTGNTASTSTAGVTTTGAQRIGGAKTFSDNMIIEGTLAVSSSLSASNLSGTNTGNVSLGTASLGLTLAGNQVISGVAASTSTAGVVSTGAQSFAGTKTFANIINSGLTASRLVLSDGSKQLTSGPAPVANTYVRYDGSNYVQSVAPGAHYFSGFNSGTSWTTTANTFGDGTNTGGNSLTTRVSGGMTVTAGASNVMGISFTPTSTTAVYQIDVAFTAYNSGAAANNSFRLFDGTNTLDTASSFGQNVIIPVSLHGIFAPGSTSAQTVKVQIATSAGTLRIDNEHVSGLSSEVIGWRVVRIVN